MPEHDQRLKEILREFLPDLVALVLPQWAARFDFAAPEWLEQEVFVDPPHGERRELDLVARLPVREPLGTRRETLLHLEVESGDSAADLRRRMPLYHGQIGQKHGLPVLSLAVYLGVALDGLGWDSAEERYWEEALGETRWPYVGLPGLDAEAYVEGDNLLGVAFTALMRAAPERRARLKARAMERLAAAPLNPHRRYLLMEFVHSYLPLEEPHLSEYRRLLLTEEYPMALKIGKTLFEEGMEKGVEQGIEKGVERGQRALLRDQLEVRFGPLGAAASARLEALSGDALRQLGRDLLLKRDATLADLGLEDAVA